MKSKGVPARAAFARALSGVQVATKKSG